MHFEQTLQLRIKETEGYNIIFWNEQRNLKSKYLHRHQQLEK